MKPRTPKSKKIIPRANTRTQYNIEFLEKSYEYQVQMLNKKLCPHWLDVIGCLYPTEQQAQEFIDKQPKQKGVECRFIILGDF